jgi:hypothetical protein
MRRGIFVSMPALIPAFAFRQIPFAIFQTAQVSPVWRPQEPVVRIQSLKALANRKWTFQAASEEKHHAALTARRKAVAAPRKIFCLMKSNLSKVLVVVSILLAIGLAATKWSDNAQLETAAATINDYSNRLDMAQAQISIRDGSLLTLSNSLVETSLALSNQLTEAQSTLALQTEQITNLNRQVTTVDTENQNLNQQVMDLTNQLAVLTSRNTETAASLAQANTNLVQAGKDYAQLENRLRRDVAERIVVERKFNSFPALEAQMRQLKEFPAGVISPENIYAGLDVVVNGDGKFYVISPD